LTTPPYADLTRPRDLTALLRDALALYFRYFPAFIAIALVVVVPVDAIVLGLGLGEFSAHYRSNPSVAETAVPTVVGLLVTRPLVSAMVLFALLDAAKGEAPRLGSAIQRGLDVFAEVFLPVLATVGLLIVTIPTIIGPIIVLVRLYFTTQVVIVDRRLRIDALRASWELTRGFGLRVFGVVVVTTLGFGLVVQLVATPLLSAAKSANSEALVLAGQVLGELLTAAPIGLVGALLFFDLRVRQRR
jgi:hypothetical protein